MLARSGTLVAATSWWLGAGAFLIPVDLDIVNSDLSGARLSSSVATQRNTQVVTIPCPACAFAAPKETFEYSSDQDDDWVWIQGGAKNVAFNITVADSGSSIQIGGATVYPLIPPSDLDAYGSPVVYQVAAGASPDDVASGRAQSVPLSVTDSSIGAAFVDGVANPEDTLVVLHYKIFALTNQPVELDSVEISVLQTKDAGLVILDVHTQPSLPVAEWGQRIRPSLLPSDGAHRPVRCGILPDPICRLVHGMQSKFYGKHPNGIGCKGQHKGQSKEHMANSFDALDENRHPGSHRGHHALHPHAGHQHHRHHGGRFRHGFLPALFRGLVAALIPIMLGVFAGMTVSLIGLGVGRLIGFLWFNLIRGGRRGYASVALDDAPTNMADDGSGEADIDLPPKYEAAYSLCEKGT